MAFTSILRRNKFQTAWLIGLTVVVLLLHLGTIELQTSGLYTSSFQDMDHVRSKNEFVSSYNDSPEWRTGELERLGDLVQRRLEYIQNPADCDAAKKVWCNLTVIDLSRIEDIKIISLPRQGHIVQRPPYLPFAIPEDLASNLTRVHENPSGWWIGQILKYLLRYNDSLRQFIEQSVEASDFDHPIVGIQVRRTDKKWEARYHDLSEYMKHVDEWFDAYDKTHSPVHRKVYLASDDTRIFQEAQTRYPAYLFVTNKDASEIVRNPDTRYSESSLRGFLLDVEMLSRCDYFVCTLSSNVGSLVYELMHVRYWDAPSRIKSLDLDFAFHRRLFKSPTGRRAERYLTSVANAKVFTNITDTDIMMLNVDNNKLPVQMPTYPGVPLL